MNEINKNELSDDMLDGVAGGTGEGDTNYKDWKVGDEVTGICPYCGTLTDTATVQKISNHGGLNMLIVTGCCGRALLGETYRGFKRI